MIDHDFSWLKLSEYCRLAKSDQVIDQDRSTLDQVLINLDQA